MNSYSWVQPMRGDARGFVHKRFIGGVVGGVTGFLKGGPAGVVGGAVGGFVRGGAPTGSGGCPPGFNPSGGGCVAAVAKVPGLRGFAQRVVPGGATGFEVQAPRMTKFTRRIARERAARVEQGLPAFINGGVTPPFLNGEGPAGSAPSGEAVVGRFGAGIEPDVRRTQIRDCPRGMVLAVDDLCYNRRDLRNSERFWPRGRRPLLTGGEMRAISTAASAARKLQRKQKDLMKLGLLPKPTARRRQAAVSGHKATLEHT